MIPVCPHCAGLIIRGLLGVVMLWGAIRLAWAVLRSRKGES